jgi:hypothetical protein
MKPRNQIRAIKSKKHTLVVPIRNKAMENFYSDESFYSTPFLKKWSVDQKGNKDQADNYRIIQNELKRRNQQPYLP